MTISFSATNPCHMYPLALAIAREGALGCYYSGYPAWKLADSDGIRVRTHSLRTNIVYGLLKFAPESLRPSTRALFRWQDDGFDRWTGAHLERSDFVHAMPGQALHTFRAARKLGVRTVLNHATGPVREWARIMEPEYSRVGLKLTDVCPYDAEYFAREDEEYALADFHCAASTVVRDQLVALGVDAERIWLVPYGADEPFCHPERSERQRAESKDPEGKFGDAARSEDARVPSTAPLRGSAQDDSEFRIVFAGQVGLRKGIKTLLDALTAAGKARWRVDFYGTVLGEARHDLDSYRGPTQLHFHGPVSQVSLADAFRAGSVLVLPSLEEGFGLVVPQALNCGLPCIVSSRVGGKDLVRHRENGSTFPVGKAEALVDELRFWEQNPARPNECWRWDEPARRLLSHSAQAIR